MKVNDDCFPAGTNNVPPASSSVQRIDRSQPLVYVTPSVCVGAVTASVSRRGPFCAGEAFVGVGGAPPTTLPIREAGGYPVGGLL